MKMIKFRKKVLFGGCSELDFSAFLHYCHSQIPKNSIFVMDNAPAHRSSFLNDVVNALLDEGRLVLFQSKYSPDLNPIEMVFGNVKRKIKKFEQRAQNISPLIHKVINEMPPLECRNTIQHVFGQKEL